MVRHPGIAKQITQGIIILIALVSFSITAISKVLYINEPFDNIDLKPYLSIYFDPTNNVALGDLKAPDGLKFQPLTDDHRNLGIYYTAVWIQLEIINNSSEDGNYILELDYPHIDYSDFYLIDSNGSTLRHLAGDKRKLSEKTLPHRNQIFPCKIEKGARKLIYVRMQTEGVIVNSWRLWSQEAYLISERKTEFAFGIYFGVFLTLLLYSIFMSLLLRSKPYLYYVGFISAFFLFQISLYGLGGEYLWSEYPGWSNLGTMLGGFLTYILVALFSESFLDLNLNSITTRRLWDVVIVLSIIGIFATPFIGYSIVTMYLLLITILTTILLLWSGIICSYKNYRPAFYYLAAWMFLGAAGIVNVLCTLGVIERGILVIYSMQFGSTLAMIFLTLGLTDRSRILTKENERTLIKGEENMKLHNLVRVLCHDIANSANLIRLSADIALEEENNANLTYLWRNVNRAANMQKEIIGNIRYINALGAGKIQLKLVPVSLEKVINDGGFVFNDRIKAKDLHIKVSIKGEDDPMVLAEQTSLSQNVYNNILSNAIKFSFRGGIIDIKIEKRGSNKIVLILHDNGKGIPKEILNKIFDGFEKTTRPGTEGEPGTGFGMPVVKQFMEAYGGSITIKSRDHPHPHHGTTVELIFRDAA